MPWDEDTLREFLDRVRDGNPDAAHEILMQYRDRLKQMVIVYFDARLARRIDPSDVVQETLIEASRRLAAYVQDPPLPFYPWLRQLAQNKLRQVRRYHLTTGKRAVSRELPLDLSDESVACLATRLVARSTDPGDRLLQEERKRQIQTALSEMPATEREVLVLRYLEQLSPAEAMAAMGISQSAYLKRHYRALLRLRRLLDLGGGTVR